MKGNQHIEVSLNQWFRNFSMHQNCLEGLLKQWTLEMGSTHRVSDSVDLWLGLRICIFNKFSGDADVAGLGNTLRITDLNN